PRITVSGMCSNLDSSGLRPPLQPKPAYWRPILPPLMRASFRRGAVAETAADTVCVGLLDGEGAPSVLDDALGGRLGRLIESGEAKTGFKKTAILHPDGAIGAARVITVGLGKRDELDSERARIAAAVGYRSASGAGARAIAWAVPEKTDQPAIG